MERRYPRSENSKLWKVIEAKLRSGDILVSSEVILELKAVSVPTIGNWIDTTFPRSVIDSDASIQNIVSELVNKYEGWIDPHSTSNTADPYVIAVAKRYAGGVVTLERPNINLLNNPEQIANQTHALKIPNVCSLESIACLDIVRYLVEIGSY